MKISKIISVLSAMVLISFGAITLHSEENDVKFGIFGGVNFNMHSPDFTLPYNNLGTNNIFKENKTSIGIHLGGLVDYKMADGYILSGRLGFHSASVLFQDDRTSTAQTGGVDTTLAGEFDASVYYVEISPMVKFTNLLPVDDLYLLGGLELGIPISAKYDLNNQIAMTENDINNVQTLNTKDEDIEGKSLRMAIALGAGYNFEIGDGVELSPEVSFRLPLTKVSSNDNFDSWSMPQVRVGVSLTFGGNSTKVNNEPEPGELSVGFNDVSYYDTDGTKKPLKEISVEETEYQELYPVLPYVFCSENSTKPDTRYQNMASQSGSGEFSFSSLEADALAINYNTMDIIGRRMQTNKQARIRINGTLDGRDEVDLSVAKERAQFAKNYIVVNYGINPDRIDVSASKKPEKPSAMSNPDGMQENRRIEFFSTNHELLEPILLSKDKQRVSFPQLIEFNPAVVSSEGVKNWELRVLQAGRIIKQIAGTGTPKPVQWSIMPNDLTDAQVPLDYTFEVIDNSGKVKSSSGSIPVEYYSFTRKRTEDMPDKTISKYSLVVFDFDSPEISEADKKILEDKVIPAINYNSTVQIYGYTDKLGNDSYNKKLALQRANNVKNFLESKVKNVKFEVYGVGESVELFDNNSPIGRQLSRTVQVYVVTPKQ